MPMTAKQIRRTGTVIFWGGLVAAIAIFATARPEERLGILGVDIRTNRDRMQLERMGGKSYVMLKYFDDWFAALWHGRQLAGTVAVLSFAGYWVCRGLARVEQDLAAVEGRDPGRKEKSNQT